MTGFLAGWERVVDRGSPNYQVPFPLVAEGGREGGREEEGGREGGREGRRETGWREGRGKGERAITCKFQYCSSKYFMCIVYTCTCTSRVHCSPQHHWYQLRSVPSSLHQNLPVTETHRKSRLKPTPEREGEIEGGRKE